MENEDVRLNNMKELYPELDGKVLGCEIFILT